MCKFSRTLYNRQLIQFSRIPVEFVARFIRYQNCEKVHFPWLLSICFQYLHTVDVYAISEYNVYSCTQRAFYHSITRIKRFIFQENLKHWLSQTRSSLLKFCAQHSERGYVLWNLSSVCGPHHHDSRFYLFTLFSRFFNRSLIPVTRFLIPDPPSSILAPDFPVNLEVLLIKIVVFSTTEVTNCSKVLNAFRW